MVISGKYDENNNVRGGEILTFSDFRCSLSVLSFHVQLMLTIAG